MTSSNHPRYPTRNSSESGARNFIAPKPRKTSQSVEINALLRGQIAHLWPTLTNNTALQKQCAVALPQLFLYCQVLHLDAAQLTVAAPNAALASKLKQQLPKLQDALQKAGWQINAIRIKVQVSPVLQKESADRPKRLSGAAIKAFSELEQGLTGKGQNQELLDALRTMLNKV